jgi:hypothetical protein
MKATGGKAHCHNIKSACPANDLALFYEFAAVKIPKLEGRILS